MSKAIVIEKFGGPEVLNLMEVRVAAPGPGEVLVRHTAIALNFIDIYHREGLYPNPLPFTPGVEAAGIVEAVGEGVTSASIGDHVVYFRPIGSYAQVRLMPAELAIPIPRGIEDRSAAAIYSKGLTARYLIKDTFEIKSGTTILFHAAAGGVGQLACAWAAHLGARVIGTVGSDAKVDLARNIGCNEVINLKTEDFVERVRDLTGGNGVDVVYDSIGKDSFERSLACLRPRGMMVSFGNSSGPVSVPNLGILATGGSLYVTRPTLVHYYPDRAAELVGARDLFDALKKGIINASIGQTFALEDVAKAHIALKGRQTVGSTLLMP